MYCMKNGTLYNAGIDLQDRAFLYGDGFFTTIAVKQGQPQLWERHLLRLNQCAEQLLFNVDFSQVQQHVNQLIEHVDPSLSNPATVKIIVSRGIGLRGYLAPDTPADVYIQYFPREITPTIPIDETGVLNSHLGQVMPQLVGLKTLNRLEQVILRGELAAHGWREGLVCDNAGYVVEGVFSNCFLYLNGKWITPLLEKAGVAGVMRAEILAQMEKQSIEHQIALFPVDALAQVEALFFCNALTGIVPVRSLQGRALNLGIVQHLLQQLML